MTDIVHQPVYVGIRKGIKLKVGQASIHRLLFDDPTVSTKAMCGKETMRIRPLDSLDFYHRCPKCFGRSTKEDFERWAKVPSKEV